MFYEVTLPFIYVMCLISEATTQHLYDNLANRKNHLMVNPFLLVFEVAFNERNEKNNTFCTSNILSFGILLSILGQDVKKFFCSDTVLHLVDLEAEYQKTFHYFTRTIYNRQFK